MTLDDYFGLGVDQPGFSEMDAFLRGEATKAFDIDWILNKEGEPECILCFGEEAFSEDDEASWLVFIEQCQLEHDAARIRIRDLLPVKRELITVF